MNFLLSARFNRLKKNGILYCGILSSGGDGIIDNTSTGNSSISLRGLDEEFCRALSASLFYSDTLKVEFIELSENDDWLSMLNNGSIDVMAGSLKRDIVVSNVTANITGCSYSPPYYYDEEMGKANSNKQGGARALATSQNDSDWNDFVYWVVAGTFIAEENEATRSTFTNIQQIGLFGEEFEWMLRDAIIGTGNYEEIYAMASSPLPSRSGKNLLNTGSSPQIHALL